MFKSLQKHYYKKDAINVFVVSKANLQQYNTYSNSEIEIMENETNPDIIFAASGDYSLIEILEAKKILNKELPEIKIKIVYVTNISILKSRLSEKEFEMYFNKNVPVIYNFHGYKSTIKNLLFERKRNFKILGYIDKGDICASSEGKKIVNETYRYNIVIESLEILIKNNKNNNSKNEELKKIYNRKINDFLKKGII